ncbi:hypothetical protein FHU10_0615 [Serratia fonticola]|uniref:Uncharacterized protein n=1 Tax=Serratia fonticola TaxID=47917 RepID=A0A559T0Q8_SERFO|nr:hypothetical protein [Serratia fonticola]TQI79313.1 hypothetical protein FHU09_1834 [Serratia fonticola]TQI98662.1 hypothetical protein FHU11_4214 [Serratia fonticola]TVZ68189.1 hypothetical protein FHU10_0615 [Serratia fonticola]
MRHSGILLVVLLTAAPFCRASLNTLASSELPRIKLAQTCSVLNAAETDWGDINAVVQSARACLQQKQWQGPDKRALSSPEAPQGWRISIPP